VTPEEMETLATMTAVELLTEIIISKLNLHLEPISEVQNKFSFKLSISIFNIVRP
jgi:hypothetical protein